MQQEPSLKDLIIELWNAKWFIAVFCILLCLGAFLYIRFSQPLYKAQMIIAPADGYALGDYASAGGGYDRTLAIPFWRPSEPESTSTDYYRFIYSLTGPSVAGILLRDESVLAAVQKDKRWKEAEIEDLQSEALAYYFEQNLKIEQLGATPLRRISFTHPDQVFASALLRKINLVADQMIRRDRRVQSESRVRYLENALAQTKNPDHRKIITNLLMQQEHVRMLANLDEPYAAIVVERPYSKPSLHWPKAYMIYPAALFAALLLGYVAWAAVARPKG